MAALPLEHYTQTEGIWVELINSALDADPRPEVYALGWIPTEHANILYVCCVWVV